NNFLFDRSPVAPNNAMAVLNGCVFISNKSFGQIFPYIIIPLYTEKNNSLIWYNGPIITDRCSYEIYSSRFRGRNTFKDPEYTKLRPRHRGGDKPVFSDRCSRGSTAPYTAYLRAARESKACLHHASAR